MKDILTSVLLSIKPLYAQAIMSGTKKVEFRKKVFKRKVNKVFVYSSSPEKSIIGYFVIGKIKEASPDTIWSEYKEIGGISEKDFFAYYANKNTAFAIEINSYVKFNKVVNPKMVYENFCAPQSYLYVDANNELKIMSTSVSLKNDSIKQGIAMTDFNKKVCSI